MELVDLTYVNTSIHADSRSFMSAASTTGDVFILGEHTSDFLSYFGFGSGDEFVPNIPLSLEHFVMFDFPCPDEIADPMEDYCPSKMSFIKGMANVQETLSFIYKACSSNYISLEQQGLKHFVTKMFHLMEVPVSFDLIDRIVSQFPEIPGTPKPVMTVIVIHNGKRFIYLGVPPIDLTQEQVDRYSVWRDGNIPNFNHAYFTQLGDFNHTNSILHSMLRHKFVDNWEPCKKVLEKTIKSLPLVHK